MYAASVRITSRPRCASGSLDGVYRRQRYASVGHYRTYIVHCHLDQHLPHTAVCCPGEGVQGKYNTAAPLYSSFLANKLNMRKVYQQYVLYMAGVAVTVSMATRFTRACNLIRYVNYSKHGRQSEPEYAAWMAQAQPHELERAERVLSRFRSGNVSAAFASPMLWMAFKAMPSSASYSR